MNEQKLFAGIIGTVLIARGLLGFLLRALPGDLSAALDHNFIHTIVGLFFIWVSLYARPRAARGWNKFLGYVYAVVTIFGFWNIAFLANRLGANSVADNAFNFAIAAVSLLVGYRAEKFLRRDA